VAASLSLHLDLDGAPTAGGPRALASSSPPSSMATRAGGRRGLVARGGRSAPISSLHLLSLCRIPFLSLFPSMLHPDLREQAVPCSDRAQIWHGGEEEAGLVASSGRIRRRGPGG
jgi:hypothetical protein